MGQVVVLDRLGTHRTEKVRELIEARGCDLLSLPSYSPDLNSMEEAFSGSGSERLVATCHQPL